MNEDTIQCAQCGAPMPNDAYAQAFGRCARHADEERAAMQITPHPRDLSASDILALALPKPMSTPSKCPFHSLRAGLPDPIPANIAALPVDERGYPVPWFVAWLDGKPEFRAADARKRKLASIANLCWVCGKPLGDFFSFVIGPMCALNRTTGEPPSHDDCAEWSVKACPFLTKPQMIRREDGTTDALKAEKGSSNGIPIDRNPGVTLIWKTNHYHEFPDHQGGKLINIGPAHEVSWWREGRPATRAEILESIDSGLPLLRAMDPGNAEAEQELQRRYNATLELLPQP